MKKIEVELMPFSALMHVTTDKGRSGTFEFTHTEFRNLAQQTREAIVNLDGYETVICAALEVEVGDRLGGMIVTERKPKLHTIELTFENRAIMHAPGDSIFTIERKIQ